MATTTLISVTAGGHCPLIGADIVTGCFDVDRLLYRPDWGHSVVLCPTSGVHFHGTVVVSIRYAFSMGETSSYIFLFL